MVIVCSFKKFPTFVFQSGGVWIIIVWVEKVPGGCRVWVHPPSQGIEEVRGVLVVVVWLMCELQVFRALDPSDSQDQDAWDSAQV